MTKAYPSTRFKKEHTELDKDSPVVCEQRRAELSAVKGWSAGHT